MTEKQERAYVVFQGGGALGVAHFGAWQAIAENFDIVGVAGTSSGSIAAALCAAGYSPDEAFESFKQNLPSFFKYKSSLWSLINIIFRAFFGRDASNDGSRFKYWLDQQLQRVVKVNNIDFEKLYEYSGIYLEIIACDLNDPDNSVVRYSPDVRKRESIADAVRASISLPGFFTTIRSGNRKLVDGGLILNFPIENLYERARREECVLIGVRFKKSQRSFNAANILHVFSKSYEIVMGTSSKIPENIKRYPKCEIIEIDDRGFNPLNFNLSESQLLELRKTGEEVAREDLEKLQKKLKEVKSKLRSQLSSNTRELVDQAQSWFTHEVIPKIENYCKHTLDLEKFRNLVITEREFSRFCWEINKYIERISESLLDEDDYSLLENELLQPSFDLEIYLQTLDLIKGEVPEYLVAKQELKKRIDYLKRKLIQNQA